MWIKTGTTTFSGASSVSLNNCFSADYEHYMVFRKLSGSVSEQSLRVRLRSSGVDSTGTNYRAQVLIGNGTSVTAVRSLPGDGLDSWNNALGFTETTTSGMALLSISYPYQAQITVAASDMSYDIDGNLRLYHCSWSHDLTTAYDGITVFPDTGTITGSFTVYGLRES